MTLECDAKFKEKLTCGLENDMRNLTLKNLKNLHFHGLILTKIYVSAKKVQSSYK